MLSLEFYLIDPYLIECIAVQLFCLFKSSNGACVYICAPLFDFGVCVFYRDTHTELNIDAGLCRSH